MINVHSWPEVNSLGALKYYKLPNGVKITSEWLSKSLEMKYFKSMEIA